MERSLKTHVILAILLFVILLCAVIPVCYYSFRYGPGWFESQMLRGNWSTVFFTDSAFLWLITESDYLFAVRNCPTLRTLARLLWIWFLLLGLFSLPLAALLSIPKFGILSVGAALVISSLVVLAKFMSRVASS